MSKGISGLFVGTTGWTVQTTGRLIPGQDGVVTGGSSKKLKGNLMQNMGLLKSTSSKGYQAQHIIPHEMANHPILQKIGMDLDDASNGIFLPAPNKGVNSLSTHRGYHSVYSDFVRSKLDRLDINKSSIDLQREVLHIQTKLRKLQESGLPLYKGFSENDGKTGIYPKRKGNTVKMWEKWYNQL